MTLQNYYNRFNPAKYYDSTLFLSGRGLQSAELNEIQNYAKHNLKSIGDAIFGDGDVVEGTAIVVNPDTGETTVEAGKLYLRGAIREVSYASFTIPISGSVRVGLYYTEATITELEDSELRDPAVGTRNYQEPGAARLQINLAWGFEAEGITAKEEGDFYPVYLIKNGVLILQSPPPQLDAVTAGLARYDRESNGSYIVSGLGIRYLETDSETNEQVFVVSEGKAHVNGYEIELTHSLRLRYPEEPDIAIIESEPHIFQGDENGVMRLEVNHTPIASIDTIDVTRETTVTVTHGSFTGSTDPLPDETVLEIVLVTQGATSFEFSTDYQLTGGDIDWSPAGNEPAPGSSYDVTYRYREQIAPINADDASFEVHNVVDNTLVLVDYSWKMPRFDLLMMNQQGHIQRMKGIGHPWKPSIPNAPQGQLVLGYIEQTWQEEPKAFNSAVHAIPMQEIESMREAIADLYDLVAQERLRNDANASDPSTKLGVFVDPFLDDDMRDQGITQTAAIVDGALTLPISAAIADTAKVATSYMLPYILEPLLEQPLRTGEMKVNPYQAFAPVPAKVTLNLAVDRWTEVNTTWSSPITRRFSRVSSPLIRRQVIGRGRLTREIASTNTVSLGIEQTQSTELLSSTSEASAFMREVTQEFTVEGFQPGEELTMMFDGIEIEPIAL